MDSLSKLLKDRGIKKIGYIPKKTEFSENGNTTVIKTMSDKIVIWNPQGNNYYEEITNSNKIFSIIWENIPEPA